MLVAYQIYNVIQQHFVNHQSYNTVHNACSVPNV